MNETRSYKRMLWPVLAGFFIMGFCDLVAPVTKLIASELTDPNGWVNFLPVMVFVWFLILSIPITGVMNRQGRKRTALYGYALTIVGLMIPFLGGSNPSLLHYFLGFGLLGIGNTFVQVAVNPLLATIVPEERMTSYLTIGQIFRNTSLLLSAPLITLFAAWTGSWRWLLVFYGCLTLAGGIWLQQTPIQEPTAREGSVGWKECYRLLGNRTVLLCTLGVACFISADVGINFVAVRLIDQPTSILMTTGFYASRIIGTLIGAWVLTRYSDLRYLKYNMAAAFVLCLLLCVFRRAEMIYAITGILGFTFACAFATFYAQATKAAADRSNEVAGLMILAISAGMLPGPICGALIAVGDLPQWGLIFPAGCIAYMGWAAHTLIKQTRS